MVEQHYCLRWNNYRTNITAEFETLREGEHFVDVTLACDGRQLKAHKVVLSACSPYFKELLQGNPCSHPIIILKDVAYMHMRSLLEFMYAGEVNISQAHLGSFLHTAEALKIRGLAESSEDRKDGSGSGNCLSPLSALKTSLGSFGGISLPGLSSSLLDRSLMPTLLPHPGEPPPPTPSQPPTPNLVPSSLPLPGTSYTSTGPSSGSGKVPSPDKPSPGGGGLTSGVDLQGPIPLTVNTHINDSGGSNRHNNKGEGERKEPSSPLPLPPNKRIRSERKLGHIVQKDYGGEKPPDKASNGCPYSSVSSAPDTAASKLSTTAIATPTSGTEEPLDTTIPKTEPLDPPVSDTEGSVGWTEEGEGGGTGGECYPSPDPPPPSQNPLNAPTGPASSDSENTSHLVQALSEPHLPGIMRNFEPLPCPICQRSYSSPGNLKQHLENIHMASNEPNHQCRICGNKFKSKWYLHKHLHRAHHIRGRK